MTNKEQAEKLLRESAQAAGLTLIESPDGEVLLIHPTMDVRTARFAVVFESPGARWVRPHGDVNIDEADLLSATPESLSRRTSAMVADAKAEIIRQLKVTLARLEATR